jgi:hypothetical protein
MKNSITTTAQLGVCDFDINIFSLSKKIKKN